MEQQPVNLIDTWAGLDPHCRNAIVALGIALVFMLGWWLVEQIIAEARKNGRRPH